MPKSPSTGTAWEGDVPLPSGRSLSPYFFEFKSPNIDFFIHSGYCFLQFSCLFYPEADEFSLPKCTILTSEDII